ncbi:MAG: hypothetical protein ABSD72_11220 [Terracidiphilus sp.]
MEAHSHCHLDAKIALDVLLESAIESRQAIFKVDRPDMVLCALDQGQKIGSRLKRHFGLSRRHLTSAHSLGTRFLRGANAKRIQKVPFTWNT